MRKYELVYIVRPDIEEGDLEGVTAKIGQLVTGSGGELAQLDSWGLRRLAYRIRKFREGYYVLAKVNLEPTGLVELRRGLALMEEVIRYLLVRVDEEEDAQAEQPPEADLPESSEPVETGTEEPAEEELGG